MSSDTKIRNYYLDDEANRDWEKMLPRIRKAMGIKEGKFVKLDDGRTIFIGGPSQGSGGATSFEIDIHNREQVDAALEYGQGISGEWYKKVNRHEASALTDYGDDVMYPEINNFLRRGMTQFVPDDEVEEIVGLIDSALSKAVISEDIQVYRGYGSKSSFLNKLSVGDEFVDKGFVSSTLVPDIAVSFGGPSVEFIIKKGSKAGFISGVYGPESDFEFLLPRNTRFKILDVDRENNHYKLEVVQ